VHVRGGEAGMSDPTKSEKPLRPRIGPIDGDPVTTSPDLNALSEHQRALRDAVIFEFKAKKVKKFVERQVEHIHTNVMVAEGIKFLFDEHGRPPANAPIEDIIEERKRIEYQIKWFEAILTQLRNSLAKVREIEDQALDYVSRNLPSGEE
jgi:hypothetical protein